MKIERLSQNKIRIFLTFDDLMERGIQKEDMWSEVPKVRELFSEMMDQAYLEIGFDASGPLAVEVFSLPAQGMVVIVTKGHMDPGKYFDGFDDFDDDVYDLEVTLEQSEHITYAFNDFEHLVSAANLINKYLMDGGSIYTYKDEWILQLAPLDLEDLQYEALIAILSEYGEASSVTSAVLDEYGKVVIADDAVKVLCTYFK